MKLEKKLSQLKDSKFLEPDVNWEKSTKYKILGEISSQNNLMKASKLSRREKIDLLFSRIIKRIIPSATKTVSVFLIFTVFFTTGFQAQASVPGEILWPVKRGMEKAELTLTIDPVKETKVHIKHVNKRLIEIDKIIKEKKSEKNDKVIKKIVKHLERDSSAVTASLEIVKEEKTALEIVELAQEVKDSARETIITLGEQVSEADNIVIEEALEEVQETNETVALDAIELALEVHEEIIEQGANVNIIEIMVESLEGEIEVSSEDAVAVEAIVTDMIIEEIEDLEENIQIIQEKVDIVEDKEFKDAQNVIEEENNGILKRIDIKDVTIKAVKEKPEEAEIVLDEAKLFLEEGSLKEALDKVSESKEINDKADLVLDKVKEVKEEKEIQKNKDLILKNNNNEIIIINEIKIKEKPEEAVEETVEETVEEVILEEIKEIKEKPEFLDKEENKPEEAVLEEEE